VGLKGENHKGKEGVQRMRETRSDSSGIFHCMPVYERFGFGGVDIGGQVFKREFRLYAPLVVKHGVSPWERVKNASKGFPAAL
jgi:hypothetical protein